MHYLSFLDTDAAISELQSLLTTGRTNQFVFHVNLLAKCVFG